MNKTVIFFDQNGAPYQTLEAPISICSRQPGFGQSVLIAPSWATEKNCYLLNGEIMECQPFSLQVSQSQIIADGNNEAVITNIPPGTLITWPDNQADEVTDGEVRFSVDLPGTYTLKFSAVEYLDQEVTIEAVPAT